MSDSLTVVVPTYQEAKNIPLLVRRLELIRERTGLDLDLLFMDDDSRDGSDELVRELGLPWVSLVTRTKDRGLSQSVLEGLNRSSRKFLVVMDADLSHPPERIPDMLDALRHGADIVVGSRFAEGGSTADDWGILRWLNSRIATLLAMPLTTLCDPMSGFFAIRRSTFQSGSRFDPIGYKIMLELVIKCRCREVVEIPIHFENRIHGASKLTFAEQFKYVMHLRRLYIFKYQTWSHLVQFLFVGCTGLLVNLAVLTLLLHYGVAQRPAVAVAILISMLTNFLLNRRFSFSYARNDSIIRQFIGFVAACALGALVNFFVATSLLPVSRYGQWAAVAGVVAGTAFNFVATRFLVFRAKHVTPEPPKKIQP